MSENRPADRLPNRLPNRLRGRCLCGAVAWEVSEELTPFAHCHCSVCRKAHGTAFATYMAANPEHVNMLSGEDNIEGFESTPGFCRRFCRTCGSVVPGIAADGHLFVPPGSADQDPGMRAKVHIFVASKAPWFVITDELRQYDGFPKSPGPQDVAAGTYGLDSDALSGSCICGAIAFEVRTPIQAAHNCHCTRCRRARSAAHACNGITEVSGVVFVRGADALVTYELPEAQFFAQAFCRTCGAIMPRIDKTRGIAVIPYGSLDGDPLVPPEDHIYVSAKSPWHPITDSLPQFGERPR